MACKVGMPSLAVPLPSLTVSHVLIQISNLVGIYRLHKFSQLTGLLSLNNIGQMSEKSGSRCLPVAEPFQQSSN
jgi:hypothetical protein